MTDATAIPQALRQDLRLYDSGPDRNGSPTWAIQDPARNRFFRIGWFEYECLLRWPGDPQKIALDIANTTPLDVDAEQVADFAMFLEQHQLLLPSGQGRQRMLRQASQPGWRSWRWWLHNYLFFRIPLLRPQRFLARLTAWLEPLFSPLALWLVLLATALGLVLTLRQWDYFTASALDSLTPSGMLGFALALVFSKTMHELGHAVVASRMGVRVGHMGVAFLVMWPMLYTDTGESWRLRSHRQRLAISIAGVTVELALAGLATLAWALLEDGILRQAALYLATTGWVLSLALNISPFMRFDGYFILSDIIGFPNLHERSGALARAWLRRAVLGIDEPWPELMSLSRRRGLVVFAFATWLYRLVVFLGIAWMVYAFFFKVLGVFLMIVELGWFVVRPIWSELISWKKRWPEVRPRRRLILLLIVLLATIGLALPWRFSVVTQGYAHAERQQLIYAPSSAMLAGLHAPGPIEKGATLVRLHDPDIEISLRKARAASLAMQARLAGLLDTEGGINQHAMLVQRLAEHETEISGLLDEAARLDIKAEFDGTWTDVTRVLRPGSWVGKREALGVLVDAKSWVVDAYVGQREVSRIEIGALASFQPQGQVSRIKGHVLAIDSVRVRTLRHPMLEARYGGGFLTESEDGRAVPAEALYRVRMRLASAPRAAKELRGSVSIDGKPQSLAWEAFRELSAIVVREGGF